MVSRTFEGKHTTRFIIEMHLEASNRWQRSSNDGLTGFFSTRAEAQARLSPENDYTSQGIKYRVRQK